MLAIRSMLKNNTRHMSTAGLIVIIAVAGAVAIVSVSGSFTRVERLTEEQKTLTARLNYLTELASTLGEGEETLGLLKQGMDELDRRLPETLDFQDFYKSLTDFALAHSILLSELKPGEAVKEESYTKMPISLKAKATFENFHAFLFEVMGLPRLAKLERLSIGVSDQLNLCSVDMTLNIYASERRPADDAQ